ncbi:prolyl oligopeptidase family serine peptidase [Desertivirga xinjiangensis]|uniref:prolyl oligopeptidase family serine peptidase n=1 Tax=Desertivirga xinjiangensis TaxID=539206 RepID=UPI00210E570A|nr:prolyl oligopeptidase family serine peptidase [Pedobacter xinjiangensis]
MKKEKTIMMGKPIFALLLFFALFTASCDKVENLIEKTFESEELLNVSYGSDANNTMDVYLPANRSEDTKIVFLIHGGYWTSGDKSEFTEYPSLLRRKGFAVVNLNYRLVNANGTVELIDQQNDLKAAVNYAYSRASEWGVSNQIGLLGASAGGHLALLYTYSNNADGKVKTVISLAGPANLTDTRNVNLQLAAGVERLVGASFLTNIQAFLDASPINKVNSSTRPTLIFHGKKDVIVPVQQSIDLKAKLDQFNVASKLVVYENTGHEVLSQENAAGFLTEVETWLKANIK